MRRCHLPRTLAVASSLALANAIITLGTGVLAPAARAADAVVGGSADCGVANLARTAAAEATGPATPGGGQPKRAIRPGVSVKGILTALTFLKGLPYVDKDKLGMFGFSKGGFNALLASTRSHDLKAVAVWGAWADMVAGYRWSQTQRNHPLPFMREAAQRHESIIGGTPEAVPEEWRIRSAINYVENVTAALLILHGGQDSIAPAHLVLPFAEALQRLGKSVEVKVYAGEDHGLFLFTDPPPRARFVASRKTAQDVWTWIVAFFDRILRCAQC